MDEQKRYRERVRIAFEDFLNSEFINYQPYAMDDNTIISDAENRSIMIYDGGLLKTMQSFASIFTIDGKMDMEYNGNDFSVLLLKPANGENIRVNFSDFRYLNSFYKGKEDTARFGYEYDSSNAKYVNLLNENMASPEILANKVGGKILIGYDFNTINRFGKLRTCYRFYSMSGNLHKDAEMVRRQILRAQAFALLLAAKYPVLCLPSYNYEHIYPYMYDITKEIGSQYCQKLRIKLSEVERAINEHGLTYEHTI